MTQPLTVTLGIESLREDCADVQRLRSELAAATQRRDARISEFRNGPVKLPFRLLSSITGLTRERLARIVN